MPTVTGLTYEQARAEQSKLQAQGKNASNSKSYGKLEDYIKTLRPQDYSADQVKSAQQKLSTSTATPSTSGGGSVSGGSLDLSGLYNQYFNTPEVQAKKDEIAKLEQQRDEAIGSVQNNPFYSQATRGGKIAAIRSDSERNLERIGNDLGRLQSDAQIKYNIQLQQYDINRQEYRDNLSLFSSLVNSGALNNANSKDIAALSVRTGIPTSMIQSIVANNKQVSLQPYEDDSGQYVLALDSQGNIVNRSFLGAGRSANTTYSTVGGGSYLEAVSPRSGQVQGSQNTALQPLESPNMSAQPGTEVEYPVGSGYFWRANAQGGWD